MASDKYAPVIGTKVALSGLAGPFPVCHHCNGRTGVIGKGILTHPGHLKCDQCGKHLSWIGASHMDALLAQASLPKARKAGVR
jgi:hypothetical protein